MICCTRTRYSVSFFEGHQLFFFMLGISMNKKRLTVKELRSYRWTGPDDLRSFGHRSRLNQMGYSPNDYSGKPVIAIINTWSDLNPCHMHLRERSAEVKRGVWQSGGFPVEIPAISITETFMKPSPLLYRNLLAMEVEEIIRSQPVDGVVLMGGCDKTTPGLLMGAMSVDLPTIYFPSGPMLRGNWQGQILGSGSDAWKYWAERRAGNLSDQEWCDIESGIARSPGHCMTMGTASTMTSIAEALGLTICGGSSIPAVDANHPRLATETGRCIVDMVWDDRKPSRILSSQSFENAITVDMAIGGSTNAIIHLLAMAGRTGVKIDLDDFDRISQKTPVLANLRPSGEFLMEDFFYAGGLKGLMWRIRDLLHLNCATVMGSSMGDELEGSPVHNDSVIRPLHDPVTAEGSTMVLRGNLAPDGAVIKPAAADKKLLKHQGRAVVFKDYADLKSRIDTPDLEVDSDSVIVLQNAGPLGAPGMPEWGMLPIPQKLLEKGVRDMVRISDSRMSGTSYGTCVLHVSPESYLGGPLALVKDGDIIELDVAERRLEIQLDPEELLNRRKHWKQPHNRYQRGYMSLFLKHVTQANHGCDFDFLEGRGGVPEPDIF